MAEYKATGSCLCGGVKFQYTKPLSNVHTCHCSMCRKSIGADFGTYGIVPLTHFKMLKEDTLRDFRSSGIGRRCFCGVCGGTLFYKADILPKSIFVSLGAVDGDPGTRVEFHIFVKDKAPWVTINDGLPRSDQQELLKLENLK